MHTRNRVGKAKKGRKEKTNCQVICRLLTRYGFSFPKAYLRATFAFLLNLFCKGKGKAVPQHI
jgi:hypothetical protein